MPGDYRVWPIAASIWIWQVECNPRRLGPDVTSALLHGTAEDRASARQAARNAGGTRLEP